MEDITVVILTHNEERNLPECISHVRWAAEIVVVDSGSSDRTAEIARSMGARVLSHEWTGFANQRNWALEDASIASKWVLFVDADEHVTNDLHRAIMDAVTADSSEAFYLCFKVIFLGKWIKRSAQFPVWHPRLLKRGYGRFRNSNTGHGETWDINGKVGYIREPYLHYSFSKGLDDWLAKHNRLSSQEAASAINLINCFTVRDLIRGVLSKNPQDRRQAIRAFSYRVPGWPLVRFFYQLVLRGGMFDGRAGWIYCALYLAYEIMITAKIAELRSRKEP